jgi:hypothetical protein
LGVLVGLPIKLALTSSLFTHCNLPTAIKLLQDT